MASLPELIGAARGVSTRSLMHLPGPVVSRLGGSPVVVGGRRLDPEMQLLLRLRQLDGPAAPSVAISKGRRMVVSWSRLVGGAQQIGAVTDRTIEGPGGPLALRFYTPRGLTGRSPALLFFHGGGWVYGGLDSHDAACRFLAEEAQVRVVAVDYRLAPEAPFPAAVDDAMAAWAWLGDHAAGLGIEPGSIAVGGDGAGGNLAAVVAQQMVLAGSPSPAFQLLICPVTDFRDTSASRATYAEGFLLTRDFLDLTEDNYLVGGEDRSDPRLSPLHGDVAGVAPAYVATAGFDPLVDEGDAYAGRLRAAGVRVEHVREEGLVHGFVNLVGVGRAAPRAVRRAAAALQRGLS